MGSASSSYTHRSPVLLYAWYKPYPGTLSANFLPHGLSMNPSTGEISGIPTSPGTFNIALYVTAPGCPIDTSTWTLTVTGLITPDSTPWPVNRARKGTLAFADLTALPSTPTAITPTTPVGNMGNFLGFTPINKLMGWRNYATTQQPGAFFPNGPPSFPSGPPEPPTPRKICSPEISSALRIH